MNLVRRPLLSQIKSFSTTFMINENLEPGDVKGNTKTFEQTIRALSDTVTHIPPVPFAYFDPSAKKYVVKYSGPIPVKVLPTKVITTRDVEGFSGSAVPVSSAQSVIEHKGGILALYDHLDALEDQSVSVWSLIFLPLPAVVYLGVFLLTTHHRRLRSDSLFARSRSARKILKKHLAEAKNKLVQNDPEFCQALSTAVSRFVSDKLGLGRGELTVIDIEKLKAEGKLSYEIADELKNLLGACDMGRFTPKRSQRQENQALLNRALKLLGKF